MQVGEGTVRKTGKWWLRKKELEERRAEHMVTPVPPHPHPHGIPGNSTCILILLVLSLLLHNSQDVRHMSLVAFPLLESAGRNAGDSDGDDNGDSDGHVVATGNSQGVLRVYVFTRSSNTFRSALRVCVRVCVCAGVYLYSTPQHHNRYSPTP
jgi:hypothetical protein